MKVCYHKGIHSKYAESNESIYKSITFNTYMDFTFLLQHKYILHPNKTVFATMNRMGNLVKFSTESDKEVHVHESII